MGVWVHSGKMEIGSTYTLFSFEITHHEEGMNSLSSKYLRIFGINTITYIKKKFEWLGLKQISYPKFENTCLICFSTQTLFNNILSIRAQYPIHMEFLRHHRFPTTIPITITITTIKINQVIMWDFLTTWSSSWNWAKSLWLHLSFWPWSSWPFYYWCVACIVQPCSEDVIKAMKINKITIQTT